VNQPDNNNDTALHDAVLGYSPRGSANVVKLLVDKGSAVVNCQDANGMTPLHVASRSGAINIVLALLERSADPSLASFDGSKTPLHLAVEAGHVDIVWLLVRYCTRVDIPDVRGWTRLAIACADGNAEIIRVLMEIHVAGESGSVRNVKRLLLRATK
jgi:ankyrin repeat protein